jgi:hypothetical protein
VVVAGAGTQQPSALLAAAGVAVLLVLLAGVTPIRSRVRRAPPGLPAVRAPPMLTNAG